jgi:Ca2+-binding RTX toxin-like protein
MRLLQRSLVAALLLLLLTVPAVVSAASPDASTAPTCAEGPATIGDTTYGTPCADVIVAPAAVETVRAGPGDDTILAGPVAAAFPYLGVGSQVFEGGSGDDVVYGQRGNDTLRGNEGNDHLFGGIGDDVLRGGPGDDQLGGGFGADGIDGDGGNDFIHGDGTIDRIADSGSGANTDTLSYATGITPGFGGAAVTNAGYVERLPAAAEHGVFLDLTAAAESENGDNGIAAHGGGVDKVEGDDFETVIGTPFSDYIVGTDGPETIYGGGGADAILGGGGGDDLDGGAGADYVDGGTASLRNTSTVSVGLMTPGEGAYSQLYLTGRNGNDIVTAAYSPGSPATVTFSLEGSSIGSFDTSVASEGGCGTPTSTQLVCVLSTPLDSIVLAGMGGDDSLKAVNFPSATTVVILGGDGGDALAGGVESEDVLVDGPDGGGDVLTAFGGDDALLHNDGADQLLGGDGNDLFLSVSICDRQVLKGEAGRDNASWARLKAEPAGANLGIGKAGKPGPAGTPTCPGGSIDLDSLQEIEDLEGSEAGDSFYGDGGPNQLLGHRGPDIYSAAAGNDTILANSGNDNPLDPDPFIDCGEDSDRALVDHPQFGQDATPVNCEAVLEADPNSFQLLPDFPVPTPAPEGTFPVPPQPTPPVSSTPATPHIPAPDRKPPRTMVLAHPRAVLTTAQPRRRVAFRFASSEPGSRFRCRLDRGPYRPCSSPRSYAVPLGRHAVRILAIDATGNADPTPALFRFRVRQR